jgi:DNA-binding CsgD family transcriptional regulator
VPGADRFPFELARVRLAFGEHLRRVRATGAARLHLAAARDVFTRLGARPWVARAETELRATGVSRSPAGPATMVVLTPQEHEISQLAASGLTNKQIGAQLYLSPRTVSAHLYRVFPKLGISSRAALRDALARVPQEAGAARRPAVPTGPVPPRPVSRMTDATPAPARAPSARTRRRPGPPARAEDGGPAMPTYRMVYGDGEQVVRETFDDVVVEREDGWTVLFRGNSAILRVQDAHVQSLERVEPQPG